MDGVDASALNGFNAQAGGSVSSRFSLGNKKPRLVSIHAESTGVTRLSEVRPVLEGSGRDADPCQRQLLGPSVITKMIGPQRTGGGQRLQPVFCIVCQASTALCRSIRRRVIGSGGRGGTQSLAFLGQLNHVPPIRP